MLTAFAMVVALLGPAAPATPLRAVPAATGENRAGDEAAIRERAAAWGGAFVRGDVDMVDRLLADDFVGTAKNGTLYDKRTMMGWVRDGPNLSSNKTTVDQIRFFGDIAIATGTDVIVGPTPEMRRIKTIWTDIWIFRKGEWRVIGAHDMAGILD